MFQVGPVPTRAHFLLLIKGSRINIRISEEFPQFVAFWIIVEHSEANITKETRVIWCKTVIVRHPSVVKNKKCIITINFLRCKLWTVMIYKYNTTTFSSYLIIIIPHRIFCTCIDTDLSLSVLYKATSRHTGERCFSGRLLQVHRGEHKSTHFPWHTHPRNRHMDIIIF